MINKKIKKIRRKLDKLDDRMLQIIKKRSLYRSNLSNKTKNQIVDKKRIKLILKISEKNHIRIELTHKLQIVSGLPIKAFVKYEYKNFKKNKFIYYAEVIFFYKYLCFLNRLFFILSFI